MECTENNNLIANPIACSCLSEIGPTLVKVLAAVCRKIDDGDHGGVGE